MTIPWHVTRYFWWVDQLKRFMSHSLMASVGRSRVRSAGADTLEGTISEHGMGARLKRVALRPSDSARC